MAALWNDIIALADRLEPRLRRQFLEAVANIQRRTDAAAIARAILTGQTFVPVDALPLFEPALGPMLDTLQRGFEQAGRLAAGRLTDGGVAMRFDITNPHAIEAARRNAAALVTRVTNETREAINSLVVRAVEDGVTYRDTAALIRPMVGLTARDTQAAFNYRQSLIELGLRRDVVNARLRAYVQRKIRERSLTIAQTEIMQSLNDGQTAAWVQGANAGFLPPGCEEEWLITPDDRLCPFCQAMARKRVPLGRSFSPRNPPLHPRCRCTKVLRVPKAGRRAA